MNLMIRIKTQITNSNIQLKNIMVKRKTQMINIKTQINNLVIKRKTDSDAVDYGHVTIMMISVAVWEGV